ncbi:hypothetical protein [Vulgatibacter incomptus]|uniref:Transporter n=1 Tax=Vulgatibacter incomptus TaxID=1391653 RepID=A0A0K1PCS4_9BACT|nr:hypothetical protein [Vulgatibacter incomptus]AKU91302.1 hypothetical protein AKJ08_1689 [Vulgatibacter incomptus]
MKVLVAAAAGLALAGIVVPMPVKACAVCSCGDPTLTTMGAEQPFGGRLRVSLEARHRTDSIGEPGVNELALTEDRLEARLAWAPHESVFLLLTVPWLTRSIDYVNLAHRNQAGIGDLELHARVFLFQDREYAPRHLVSALTGVRLPTSPFQRDGSGRSLPLELQSGTGSFDPSLGLAYTWFDFPWSVYASARGTVPTSGFESTRASRSLGLTLAGQHQLFDSLGVRAGVDARVDGTSLEETGPSPDSGGWIAFGSVELLWSPVTDLVFFGSARLPAWNALSGHHTEGPIFGAGVAYDL